MQEPGAAQVTVGVLHPGTMGAAVAGAAARGGARVLWCSAGRSAATATRARATGLAEAADLAALLAASDVVLSICPPAAAEDLACEVAALRYRGVFVDANAISRDRMVRIAGSITAGGGRPVDGSIIGPPPVDGAGPRFYLAGPAAAVDTVAALFAPGPGGGRGVERGVEVVRLGEALGAASALKMAFAGYQKATRMLAALAHALAARHGVTEALLAEAARLTTSPLVEPDYLPSVAARAWRWEPEMHEVADILAAEGLPTDLALAAATVLERWELDRDTRGLSLPAVLEQLHDQPG
ncbi:MAG: DUF1932 domain-containing protein [Pseudonocardia sp.]